MSVEATTLNLNSNDGTYPVDPQVTTVASSTGYGFIRNGLSPVYISFDGTTDHLILDDLTPSISVTCPETEVWFRRATGSNGSCAVRVYGVDQ